MLSPTKVCDRSQQVVAYPWAHNSRVVGSRVQDSDILDGNFSGPLIKKSVPQVFVLELATDLRVLLKYLASA